ncbi:amino acid ABC transporter permease [Psychromicrobium lacuslunae]|uniref:Amino acid ABC transporter permease n=1 Tax=Psychromicrobium lacuslunae TaxID=1618207 RepID=A0A0D4BZP3_9MICC|nr:amino acid ABC transporter permease [Psychromicrobium lacuslunae]AJT41561.1 amino acid ABC transporter permease [Psychromicrobium lacuslunae]
MSASQVLFDAPGPKARRNNVIISIVAVLLLLGAIAWIVFKFAEAGQFEASKWSPFSYTDIQGVLLKGLGSTLLAAALGTVFAMLIGVIFAVGRLSTKRWISLPTTIVLEFFRGLPVLLLMFGVYYLGSGKVSPLVAVVTGLALYNGMVIAEIIRAGVLALPKGQGEAATAVGLTRGQTLRTILLPQAFRSMLPTIIAQVVVLLKDSALGYLVTYQELLYAINNIGRDYQNLLPAFIVGAAIFILINLLVAAFAKWLERRLSRSPKKIK